MKEKLEKCGLKQNEVTLMSLDIVNMYPSIRVKLIQKALNYYAKNLPAAARETIDLCMDIVQFGMKSTLIQFQGRYYVYKGAAKVREILEEDVALAIGAYKLAFLANIMASYVFEETEGCFVKCIFRGIYRDDGLVIFTGKWTRMQIACWLSQYQTLVNRIVEGDYLQFTMEVWSPTEPSTKEFINNNNNCEFWVIRGYKSNK